jgi:hypothetical protein
LSGGMCGCWCSFKITSIERVAFVVVLSFINSQTLEASLDSRVSIYVLRIGFHQWQHDLPADQSFFYPQDYFSAFF